jgi:hypothetical protein
VTAPATPNPGSVALAGLYDGLTLRVLGVASGVNLTASGHGTAFKVPISNNCIFAMCLIHAFSAAQIDSGITLSLGYTGPAYGELFSAAFGFIIGKGVTSVSVDTPGSGYTSAPAISFTASDLGRGATAHSTSDGSAVTGIIVDNPGTGYVVAPTVVITGAGTLAAGTATIGTATVPPRAIIVAIPPNLARIGGGMTVSWAITNAVAAMGTCTLTFLGGLL